MMYTPDKMSTQHSVARLPWRACDPISRQGTSQLEDTTTSNIPPQVYDDDDWMADGSNPPGWTGQGLFILTKIFLHAWLMVDGSGGFSMHSVDGNGYG